MRLAFIALCGAGCGFAAHDLLFEGFMPLAAVAFMVCVTAVVLNVANELRAGRSGAPGKDGQK